MNLVTPKAGAKYKVLFNILASKTRFLDINVGLKAQLSVAKFLAMIPMNLVAPKAGPKLELLFNKLAFSGQNHHSLLVYP